MKAKKLRKHIATIKLVHDFDNKKAADKFYEMLSKGLKKSLEDCDNHHDLEALRGVTLVKTRTTVSIICEDACAVEFFDCMMVIDDEDETIRF